MNDKLEMLVIVIATIYIVIAIRYFNYTYRRISSRWFRKSNAEKRASIFLVIVIPVFWILFWIYEKIRSIKKDRHKRRVWDNNKKRYVIK